MSVRHVVMFSGGAGSFEAAWRVVQQHGRHAATLLFTDTMHEDADLYRFLVESAAWLTGKAGVGEVSGLSALAANTPPVWEMDARKQHLARVRALSAVVLPQLVWLADGRDIWETFKEERFLGNSRVGICTNRLKGAVSDKWREANCDPANTVCYVGIDWSEIHRYERLAPRMAEQGWRYEAPLCEKPYLTKADILDHLKSLTIRAPRLYGLGAAHNNCGGGCVKAGVGHFAWLHAAMPEVFAHWERKEAEMRDLLGDVSILTDRSGDGKKQPLTLADLRIRLESGQQVDMYEIGGCGCFIDVEAA